MAAEGSSNLNWAEKLVIASSAITVTLDFTAVSPVLPKMLEVFGHYPHAPILVKMLMGVIGFALVIGCPLGGWLAARYNHRMLLAISLTAYAVSGAFGLFISDLYVLLATRCVIGLAAAILSTVALIALTERVDRDKRNIWIGIVISTSMLSGVLSYPIAGYMGNISWRLPYALYLITIPLAIACYFMRDKPRPVRSVEQKAKGAGLFAIPPRLMLLGFVNGMMGFLPPVYVPFHYHENGISDSFLISLSMTTSTIMGATVSIFYGPMRRRLDIWQSLTVSYVIVAIGLTIVAFSSTMVAMIGGMFVFGSGLAWLAPNLYALAGALPDEDRRAAALGLTKSALYMSSLVGVLMFEPISQAFGAQGVLIAIALCSLAMMVYVQFHRPSFSEYGTTGAGMVRTPA